MVPFIIFGLKLSLYHPSSHGTQLRFVIFFGLVIFVCFIDHLRLFVIFVLFFILCNPEQFSYFKVIYLSRARRCRQPPNWIRRVRLGRGQRKKAYVPASAVKTRNTPIHDLQIYSRIWAAVDHHSSPVDIVNRGLYDSVCNNIEANELGSSQKML